jgi:hypothetical protein
MRITWKKKTLLLFPKMTKNKKMVKRKKAWSNEQSTLLVRCRQVLQRLNHKNIQYIKLEKL